MNTKKIQIALFSSVFAFSAMGQKMRELDKTNMREGETVEYCHQHKKQKELMNNPEYIKMMKKDEEELQQALKKGDVNKGTVYKIPIVFHILHNGGPENISDAQVFDVVNILNRDLRKLNQDANNVHPDFEDLPSDVEVEFVLATKAPDGTCFKGITRTLSTATYDGDNGNAQVTAIRNGNNVFQGNWPGNRYLNVFVCADIGGAAGYTTKPAQWSASQMGNGIWMLHNYTGSIGTGSVGTSRTLTHEVGHWLNLDHTWGPNNNPGNASSCSSDDAVQDTPNCIGVTSCNINANTCEGDNDYWGFNIRDNVENYMDYSYCSKMFTPGQVARMRAALLVSSTGRSNLWTQANLNLTGANGNPVLCKADFSSPRNTICRNETITLNDESYNAVNGWTWEITPATGWSFAAGTNASSQNPQITFSQAGMYSVKLTATDGTSSNSETKANFIRVLPDPGTIPWWEGFEDYSSLENLFTWEITNVNNNNAFELESNFGHSGSKCARLTNFGQTAGSVDELTSAPIDLSVIPSNGAVTLSFRYAYRKRTSANNEGLKVFISNDCGVNWVQRRTITGNQLSNQAVSTSWQPTQQSDWTTVHMTNVTSAYFVENFRMKFRFEGDNGNNFFLDNINIYPGGPNDNIVLSVNDIEVLNGVELYPNPTEDVVNVKFGLVSAQKLNFTITDLSGKELHNQVIFGAEGTNVITYDTDKLAAGLYLVKLNTGNATKTMQFVVK